MGNVLLSLGDEDEALLRRLARDRKGGKKGALKDLVSEAVRELAKKDARITAVRRQIALMDEGFDLGLGSRKAYGSRGELYER